MKGKSIVNNEVRVTFNWTLLPFNTERNVKDKMLARQAKCLAVFRVSLCCELKFCRGWLLSESVNWEAVAYWNRSYSLRRHFCLSLFDPSIYSHLWAMEKLETIWQWIRFCAILERNRDIERAKQILKNKIL